MIKIDNISLRSTSGINGWIGYQHLFSKRCVPRIGFRFFQCSSADGGTRFRVSFAIIVQWIFQIGRGLFIYDSPKLSEAHVCVCVCVGLYGVSQHRISIFSAHISVLPIGCWWALTLIQFTLAGCHSNLCTSLAAFPLTSIRKRVCLLPPPPSSRSLVSPSSSHTIFPHATIRPEIRPNFLPITFVVSIYFSSMRFGAQRYFTLWL